MGGGGIGVQRQQWVKWRFQQMFRTAQRVRPNFSCKAGLDSNCRLTYTCEILALLTLIIQRYFLSCPTTGGQSLLETELKVVTQIG